MRKSLILVLCLAVVGVGGFVLGGRNATEAGGAKGHLLSHDVYFTMKDKKDSGKLVEACHKYLRDHAGEVFYAAGTRCQDLTREVNDQDFDVALHIVFKDKASQDQYQDAPRHKQFIDENKGLWQKVRVFDSYVTR
jgi:hypothetical protein